ncbi:MAG: hypothetical protein KDC50_07025 [Flavobacterium sp.]|nr:hypothetical protein [Flavobacterium sp.]
MFDFITSDEFTIIEKDIYEKKLALLMDMEVIESEIQQPYIASKETDQKTITSEVSSILVKPTVEFESSDIDFIKLENNPIGEDISEIIQTNEIVPTSIENVETKLSGEENKTNQAFVEQNTSTEEIILNDGVTNKIEEFNSNDSTPIEQTSLESSSEEQIPQVEEKLKIGKPIPFSQNEKHSFEEWLQLASFKPIERVEEKKESITSEKPLDVIAKKQEETTDKQKKLEIIDKFIEANPRITPAKEIVDLPSKPIEISDTTHFMTETLARVYLEQKKYSKAIQAYEILILKYPEKSIFFADRIKDIKILQQNNQ